LGYCVVKKARKSEGATNKRPKKKRGWGQTKSRFRKKKKKKEKSPLGRGGPGVGQKESGKRKGRMNVWKKKTLTEAVTSRQRSPGPSWRGPEHKKGFLSGGVGKGRVQRID